MAHNFDDHIQFIPSDNSSYSKAEYWDMRQVTEHYDWFKTWSDLKEKLKDCFSVDSSILQLGCGNSTLSQDMYDDGFKKITNIDISAVVIEQMRQENRCRDGMKWLTMDALDMRFPHDETFDVALDKGTLDALLTPQKDPWNMEDELAVQVDRYFQQVIKCLNPRGKYIYITFGQPHFRKPLLLKPEYRWKLDLITIGDCFHYFIYVLTKKE